MERERSVHPGKENRQDSWQDLDGGKSWEKGSMNTDVHVSGFIPFLREKRNRRLLVEQAFWSKTIGPGKSPFINGKLGQKNLS